MKLILIGVPQLTSSYFAGTIKAYVSSSCIASIFWNFPMKKRKQIHLSPLLPLFILVIGVFFWYQSRAIPAIDEEHQMTILPSAISHVLGAKVGNTAREIRIPMLFYHYVDYVENDPGRQNLNIPPNILISQIETLKNAGYTFIFPQELSEAIVGKEKLPQKVIILSFDDGYMDFYTNVFPILQNEHVKAIAYIVPNFLDRPNYMFTFQLEEIARSPLIEIGAHTMDHYALAGMNTKEAAYEIAQSRKVLQAMLHVPIDSFAYPYGSFDLSTVQIVKATGFTNAVSVIPGVMQSMDNEYFVSRLRPGYRTVHVLLDYLQQNTFQPW